MFNADWNIHPLTKIIKKARVQQKGKWIKSAFHFNEKRY